MDMQTRPAPSPRFHYAWIVLITGTLVVFAALGLARFGYTLLLPPMQVGLGLNNTEAGVLVTSSLFGYLALSVLGGALASRFGARIVIAVGLLLSGSGMLATGLVEAFTGAVLWQALIGVGSGASNVPVMALMAAWFARQRRGFATGLAVGGSSVAMILTGPLVPRILNAYRPDGWRISWFIFGAVTVAIALTSWLLLRNHPAEKGLLPVANDGEETDREGERPRTGPLPWKSVYRSATVWHLGLVYVAFGFSYIIYLTFFSKRLIAEGGYTTQQAGTLFMMVGWASLLSGVIWGALSDVIGRKRTLIIVYTVQAVAYALFALWRVPAGFTISALMFGLTAWSIPAIMAATCGDVLGPRMAPAALGFVTLFFGVGQALGPSVAGAMADASGSFVSAYLLAAATALMGAFVASLLRPAATIYAGTAERE